MVRLHRGDSAPSDAFSGRRDAVATAIETLPITSEEEMLLARYKVRELAGRHGFSLVDQTRLLTALSELARNIRLYTKGGQMLIELLKSIRYTGIRLTFQDFGPGIEDIDLAMTDGWSSGNGLGRGLPGSKRLVDEFDLQSIVGGGTTVRIVKWSERR